MVLIYILYPESTALMMIISCRGIDVVFEFLVFDLMPWYRNVEVVFIYLGRSKFPSIPCYVNGWFGALAIS